MEKPTVRPTHQAIMNLSSAQENTRKLLFAGILLVCAMSAATFGLTLGAAEFSKDTGVSHGTMVVKGTEQTLKTAQTEKVLIPVTKQTPLTDLSEIASVVIAKANGHGQENIVQTVEPVERITKTTDGYLVKTASGEYNAPPTQDGAGAVFFAGEAQKDADIIDHSEGSDKRVNVCRIINGVMRCLDAVDDLIPVPENSIFDTCLTNDEGDQTTGCCDTQYESDMPGFPHTTSGVCTYTCTKYSSWWPQAWITSSFQDCGYSCCADGQCTDTRQGIFGRKLQGTGSGSGECGAGKTMLGF